ncbi:hypothetical protein PIB30_092370 [Stylosanthes scabra]|uniref:Uncharacterized protein n=1 Tax=Stylosanthes scabra TaxID=79078 RepID=A0ABU6TVC5_9FABA|nr:hypothetical protein [Stylosanthes scabra]
MASLMPTGAVLSLSLFLFFSSTIYVHDSDYLSTIKQGQHEILRAYITRFTKAAMEIPNLNPEVHLHAIKCGLRLGKFQETIAVNKSKTLEEFREKAHGQMEFAKPGTWINPTL